MCIYDSLRHIAVRRTYISNIPFIFIPFIVNHPLLLLPLLISTSVIVDVVDDIAIVPRDFSPCFDMYADEKKYDFFSLSVALCSSNCLQTYRVNYVIEKFLLLTVTPYARYLL